MPPLYCCTCIELPLGSCHYELAAWSSRVIFPGQWTFFLSTSLGLMLVADRHISFMVEYFLCSYLLSFFNKRVQFLLEQYVSFPRERKSVWKSITGTKVRKGVANVTILLWFILADILISLWYLCIIPAIFMLYLIIILLCYYITGYMGFHIALIIFQALQQYVERIGHNDFRHPGSLPTIDSRQNENQHTVLCSHPATPTVLGRSWQRRRGHSWDLCCCHARGEETRIGYATAVQPLRVARWGRAGWSVGREASLDRRSGHATRTRLSELRFLDRERHRPYVRSGRLERLLSPFMNLYARISGNLHFEWWFVRWISDVDFHNTDTQ